MKKNAKETLEKMVEARMHPLTSEKHQWAYGRLGCLLMEAVNNSAELTPRQFGFVENLLTTGGVLVARALKEGTSEDEVHCIVTVPYSLQMATYINSCR